MTAFEQTSTGAPSRGGWHFTANPPIQLAPFYDRPVKLGKIAKSVASSWSPFGERFYFLLVAIGIWTFFSPSLERTAEFRLDWIFEIWVRNFVLLMIVAGGLHLYLYTFRKQGDLWRYDNRAYPAKGKAFLFGNQLWDNMFWSLGPGVAVWTSYEVFFMWAYANGIASMLSPEQQPVLFVVLILLTPYWAGIFKYFQHVFLHWQPVYRWVHSRHHRNVNLAPWSGLSLHPAEHALNQADCLIFLFIPSHPIHVIFNLMHHGMGAATSHTGYHAVRLWGSRRLEIGDFFHQLHHRYFDCNYGNSEMPWDQMFDSYHDGTAQGDRFIAKRRKAMRRGAKRSSTY